MPSTEPSIDVMLKLLQHPARRTIIRVLGEKGRASYSELMKATGISDSGTFAFHLRQLEGFIVKDREGYYKLTERGLKLYRALLSLENNAGVAGNPPPQQPSGCIVDVTDKVSFRITRSLLEYLRSRGCRLRVMDVAELVIEDVDPELFDTVVESISDVAFITAPRKLEPILVVKTASGDVISIKYYEGSRPPRARLSSLLVAPLRIVGDVLSSVLSSAHLSLVSLNEPKKRVRVKGESKARRLKVIAIGASLRIRGGEGATGVSYDVTVRVRGDEDTSSVAIERNGVLELRLTDASGEVTVASGTTIDLYATGARIEVEDSKLDYLSMELTGASVRLSGVEAKRLSLHTIGARVSGSLTILEALEANGTGGLVDLSVKAPRDSMPVAEVSSNTRVTSLVSIEVGEGFKGGRRIPIRVDGTGVKAVIRVNPL